MFTLMVMGVLIRAVQMFAARWKAEIMVERFASDWSCDNAFSSIVSPLDAFCPTGALSGPDTSWFTRTPRLSDPGIVVESSSNDADRHVVTPSRIRVTNALTPATLIGSSVVAFPGEVGENR